MKRSRYEDTSIGLNYDMRALRAATKLEAGGSRAPLERGHMLEAAQGLLQPAMLFYFISSCEWNREHIANGWVDGSRKRKPAGNLSIRMGEITQS